MRRRSVPKVRTWTSGSPADTKSRLFLHAHTPALRVEACAWGITGKCCSTCPRTRHTPAYYWSMTDRPEGTDMVWSYVSVLPDSAQLKDLVSFFDECLDVYVDDTKQEIDSLFRF